MFALKMISLAAVICLATSQADLKKGVKRGIDDYGYPLGYNGWASTLKLSPVHQPVLDRSNAFAPSAHELSHLVDAAKKAAHDVYVAQQYVAAAKEDVLFGQKVVQEKETQALIAHQKSESAQYVLRTEAQKVVLAQQKLAKAKAFAAEKQLQQALKDAEAARAIQSSASKANTEIQKAEQAAKLSFFQHTPGAAGASASYPAPWNVPHYAHKPIIHNHNLY